MTTIVQKLKLIIGDATLRNRVLFVLGALVIFRFFANIPIPAALGQNLTALISQNQALGFLNLLTGGGLSAVSLVMLGVGPYITASIIMQLLTMMSPKFKAMHSEEGELGRRKFTQYSRLLSVPLAITQGYGLLAYLSSQGILPALTPLDYLINVSIVVGGSLFLMWIGELISEFGIGNGVSLIIFAGIIAQLPTTLGQLVFTFDVSQIPLYFGALVAILLIVLAVVYITEAERPVPVTYAKQSRGGRTTAGGTTYLPLRVNQAGVIPIIFALSILIFPNVIANALASLGNESVQVIATFIKDALANIWVNGILYFVLVFIFTYFYTAITFDPDAIATNLQKNGAFVPGIRPGTHTSEYLARILTRLTLVGAVFLGIIAVLPLIMQEVTNVQSLAVGGTGLLIVVSVILELVKKVDAQVSMREY
ncbi:MAG: preprotein translocase subunit SecY [Candidatus Yonathbacteria bacterium RIFCSPLOWO2_01_FULL_43_27]|uniref:Protein translocase subunit SecY n=2 Tax=Parcubacteria group TaxID=1794811 RepID=A0A1G2SDN0_9BACT|nr:MAG: Protein translocase subunit SecY [Candidatus Azambacteria bacterium GW2011_GWA1_44_9]OHA79186.1 MAG: preprotein translocase subunit SecY [Candidatus Yonathbacteria bacterium RIFCSPHIGHO2_01_FULL_44_19]OHA83065.1 MAG: preprotein translocase subunit SecY [Candidatus Yonathbacteria bacterium RIFCSPLOWO2_01_FULL_43_27]